LKLTHYPIVSKATGRRVIAYIGEIQPDADLAVEVFVLQPSAAS
jgi:hypothetical protein